MGVHVELKRKITVNGREYESLDEIPEEFRAAIQIALASSAVPETPAFRAVVEGRTADATSAESVVSVKWIVVAIGLAAMLFWLARLVF